MKKILIGAFVLASFTACSKPKLTDMQVFNANEFQREFDKLCWMKSPRDETARTNCRCATSAYEESLKNRDAVYLLVTAIEKDDKKEALVKLVDEVKSKCHFDMTYGKKI